MDAPAAGRGPVGARVRRPIRRPFCAPARPTPRRRHHQYAAVARATDASGPQSVADAAMARDAGMGYPAVSSVTLRDLFERHCQTREVMPPTMIPIRQRLLCVAHIDPDVASPPPTPASRAGRSAHAPPLAVAYPKWSVHHVDATPGQAGGMAYGPALPAARVPTTNSLIPLGRPQ